MKLRFLIVITSRAGMIPNHLTYIGIGTEFMQPAADAPLGVASACYAKSPESNH